MKAILTLLLIVGVSPILGSASAQQPAKPVLTPKPVDDRSTETQKPVTGPQVAAAGTTPVDVDPNYIIGPDDSIKIDVWKEPTFTETVLVRPDGMVSVPAVGDIPAAGRTPMQLAGEVTTQLKKFIIEPTVTVTVLAINSKRVYMVGEIGHIGPIAMTPNMTVLQAIASAGGLTPYANKKHIYILRGDVGSQKKIPFDYNKAVKAGDMQGVTLVPGDTIVVP